MPAVRRGNPGPAENFAFAHSLDRGWAQVRNHHLDGNRAAANEIELVGGVALQKNEMFLRELDIFRAAGDERQMFFGEILEERMFPDDGFECMNHWHPSSTGSAGERLTLANDARFFSDINSHRAPGDATPASHAPRSAKLI